MKKIVLMLLALVAFSMVGHAQQYFYDVIPGYGNGVRFWQDDAYKIHMGNSNEYHFGPVWDYSIKTNMSTTPGRGWTWGTPGNTPVVAFDTYGNGQIAGTFKFLNNNELEFGVGISKEGSAGKIAYQKFSDALDIVGAGTNGNPTSAGGNRKIKFWAEGGSYFNGAVGIGTGTPSTNLHVINDQASGVATFETTSANNLWVKVKNTVADLNVGIGAQALTNGFGYVWSSSGKFMIGSDGNPTLSVIGMGNGNVGIGTTTPDNKLTVNGTIHASEVLITSSVPAPDFVFEEGYELLPLNQVKSYIDENKHLPEVPSAVEMEKNGINVSEMNMLLLKKVEELTLYMIEMKKENERQNLEIQKLSTELQEMKKN